MVASNLSTKPRWDKYDGYDGNPRGTLAADVTNDQANLVIAVGLDANGLVVVGAGASGVIGVLIFAVGHDYLTGGLVQPPQAGDVIDIGKHGEIVNFIPTVVTTGVFSADTNPATAGTKYYAHADGSINATATSGVYVGHTMEHDRLILNFGAVA
jgi:hypothetical protein